MKILLMGNQNVGKSALFSRMTGVNATASNYPGTTVEFREGHMRFGRKMVQVIDVPGTYTLVIQVNGATETIELEITEA